MSGSKDVGNERGKGFAGLSTLIPDESTSDASAGKPSKSPASGAVKPSIPPAWESTVTPDERLLAPQSQTRPAKGIAWVAFTVVAIGLGALGFAVSERNTSSNSVPAGAPNHVVATQPPAQTQSQPPAREPSFPEEVRPSMGTNLVLSISEIRYCLAEAIRMEGAESSLNNYVDVDVDRFNVMVNDYNSRCGSFRYRSGALEGARRDIESHRARLKADGQARFLTPQQSDLHRSATGSDASSAAEMAGQGSQQQAQLGRAIDVVTQHFGAWSNGNELGLGQLELLYAPAVTYYGKSMPSGDVMEDKRKFSVRWPEREYTFEPNYAESACADAFHCSVTGTVRWSVSSTARDASSSGVAEAHLELSLIDGSFRISSESSKVLSRTSGALNRVDLDSSVAPDVVMLEGLRLNSGGNGRALDSGEVIKVLASAGYVRIDPYLRADYSDFRRLLKPAYLFGNEIVLIDEEYFAEWVGCCVSPGLAVTFKTTGDVSRVRKFAQENKCRLSLDTDEYYAGPLAELPSASKGTYGTLSCKERDLDGA